MHNCTTLALSGVMKPFACLAVLLSFLASLSRDGIFALLTRDTSKTPTTSSTNCSICAPTCRPGGADGCLVSQETAAQCHCAGSDLLLAHK